MCLFTISGGLHSFALIQIYTWYHFLCAWRASMNISYSASLLVKNSFSSYMFEGVFVNSGSLGTPEFWSQYSEVKEPTGLFGFSSVALQPEIHSS